MSVSRLGMFAAAGVLAVTGSGSATVSYVVDGDTLALRDGPHVRLVQIDTPEVGTGECYSRRAAKDLRKLVPAGARVGLAADPRLDSVDRYGRLLRYVFHRGLNVNLRLVEQGDATVWFYDGDRGRYAVAAARRCAAGAGRESAALGRLQDRLESVWSCHDAAGARRRATALASAIPSYPTVCIPPPPPDLDCADVTYRRFKVAGRDPHNFDGDHDGIGCES